MKLGIVLKSWRESRKMGIREAAKLLGISHGTLSRIERGKNVDGRTLTKILTWLFPKYLPKFFRKSRIIRGFFCIIRLPSHYNNVIVSLSLRNDSLKGGDTRWILKNIF